MNQFTGLERRLARVLSALPGVKRRVKKIYQRLIYVFTRSKSPYSCVSILREFDPAGETFFGYYDKSPLSAGGRYVLYHRSRRKTSLLPDPAVPVDIVVYDLQDMRELFHLQSRAYNWQQGARLHWLDEDRFVYNDFENGNYVARIGSIESRAITSVVGFPVYDTYGNTAISLNFERLNALRPDYGYRNLRKLRRKELMNLGGDGVFRVDLKYNRCELIVPLDKLSTYALKDLPMNTLHKVNHLMINPSGDKFIFLHRYFIHGRKYDRLILAGMDGQLSGILADDQMISHYCWMDNTLVLAYMRKSGTGDHFYIIDTDSYAVRIVDQEVLGRYGDGHPSVNRGRMLFDTYPNRARMKELLIYDLKERKLNKLGEFFESFNYYGETRCDLHPRWSAGGEQIFFDSVHTGQRQLYMIDITEKAVR